jgi:arylsulfatase A-like enzyme/Tfp pilus assembly protein PilF
VLLVTIDTLRADHLGFHGYTAAETPVLDGLAKRGVVFESVVAAAPLTLPSHATILTATYPPVHGALDNGYYSVVKSIPTLPEALKAAGYGTGAIISAYVLDSQYGLDRGFDTYDDDFQDPRGVYEEFRVRAAAEITAQATRWLQSHDAQSPFFLWVHYFDPHTPYAPPGEFARRFAANPYDGEIAYTDQQLGVLLRELKRSGHAKRTLVVVTADHGEALGEGGEATHGLLLRENTLHVPLVLSAGNRLPSGLRVKGVARTADIAPTILDLLGLDPLEGADGASLVPAVAEGHTTDRLAYSETRLPAEEFGWAMLSRARDDRWAWVRAPKPELYDLQADPHETTNLAGQNPEVVEPLRELVRQTLSRTNVASSRKDISPQEIEALGALGYVLSEEIPEPTGADPKDMLPHLARMDRVARASMERDHETVVTLAPSILEEDPDARNMQLFLAQSLHALDRKEEAVEAMRIAFEQSGDRDVDGTLLAMYLSELGHADESERLLRSFHEAEPDFALHSFNLGVLLERDGRLDEAVDAYRAALAANPDAVNALVNLASLLARTEEGRAAPDSTLALIDRAIVLAQTDRARLVKVDVLRNLGRTTRAWEVARTLAAERQLRGITRKEVADTMRKLPAP